MASLLAMPLLFVYPVYKSEQNKNDHPIGWTLFNVGIFLFFRAVASQVSSALLSLTSVFGMGTGGPSASSTPTYLYLFYFLLWGLLVTRAGLEPALPP